jgi:DNA-binding transcriptional regulator WhiA
VKILKNKWTIDEKNILIKLCPNKTLYEIEAELENINSNKNRFQIRQKIQKLGLHSKPIPLEQQNRIYINHNFFDDINTKEQAYVLGYWIADGWMSDTETRHYSIEYTSIDKDLLELVRDKMDSQHKITHRKDNNSYRLRINSKILHTSLKNLGFDNHKSQTAIFPNVSDDLKPHLIRGIFDGDGCTSRTIYKKLRINFLGTYDILDNIQKNLPVTPVKILHRPAANVYNLCFSHNKAKTVLDFLYQDSEGLRLERKYQKFLDSQNDVGIYAK